MPKVTVILPVYGVADYIERCTQSLLDQTLQEMQFIFVDDHGPDNSIEIAKNKIKGHAREGQFVFLRPEHNLGAGMARNYAIPYAEGEYIAFVDSDDWVEPDMFERLYNEAIDKGGTDICFGQAIKEDLEGHPLGVLTNPDIEPGIFTDKKRKDFLVRYVSLFTTYIYSREMINENDIRFPSSRSADDSYFVTCSLLFARSVSHIDKPFYHYLVRPGSVCTTKDSTKYEKRLETFSGLMSFLKQHGVYQPFKDEVDFIYIKKGYFSSVFNYLSNSLEPKRETLRGIREELIVQVPRYSDNPYFRKRIALRMLDWLLRWMPVLAMKAVPIYVRKTNQMV